MKAITELHKILSVLIITLLLAAAIPGLEETTQETAEETDNIITEEHDATSEETPAGKDETEEQKKDISEETIEETTQETIEEINPIQRQDEYEHKKKEGNETTKDVNDTHINQDTEIEHTLNTTDKDAIYVDIEEVEEIHTKKKESSTKDTSAKKEHTKEKKEVQHNKKKAITQAFYNDGKKVLEVETTEPIPQIIKKEIVKDFGKQVIISSEEHVTTPLKVYTDLGQEALKEDITIYWENEHTQAQQVAYYDENNDGRIERVSWMVPHLSTQIFNIVVETQTNEYVNATDITIDTLDAPSGDVETTPIYFKFNVTYQSISNLNCTLNIPEASFAQSGFNMSINEDLENGSYSWQYYCFDETNLSINDIENGAFTINEEFSITGFKDMYIYTLWNNNIQDSDNVDITSQKPSNVTVFTDRPSPHGNSPNVTGTAPLVYTVDNSVILGKGAYVINAVFDRLEESSTPTFGYFYVTEADLDHPTTSESGDDVTIDISLDNGGAPYNIEDIIIEYGDGEINYDYLSFDGSTFNQDATYDYPVAGTYTIKVKFEIDGQEYTISKGDITVESGEDTKDPDIDLIHPADGDTVGDNIVTFRFNASDNVKVEACNFSVYNVSTENGQLTYNDASKVYNEEKDNLDKDQEIEISLTDFYNREYAWEVECHDNSSNYEFEVNYFTYDDDENENTIATTTAQEVTNYERKEEVQELLEYATTFIEKEDDWNADEKKALEDLGLLDKVKFYKKRLLDIEQTLSKNLNFIEDPELRENRRIETLAEIDEIRDGMPSEFSVKETYEFVKNGNTLSWAEIIQEYVDQTNTQVSNSIAALVEENKEIQQGISISTNIKDIEISYYNNDEKRFMLVNKEVQYHTPQSSRILEVFPKRLLEGNTEIEFLMASDEITHNHIYEINANELEDNEIMYIIHDTPNIRNLEEVDTVLFTDKTDRTGIVNSLSGFLILGGGTGSEISSTLFIIVLIIAMLCLLLWVLGMIKKAKLKKNPNVYKILDLINSIKKCLKENNINDAREHYKKIQEQYNVLDLNMKMKVYPLLKKAQGAIDKRDIFNLVKEYKEAKNKFQKDDATNIYKDIQAVYKRLPKKDQAKVIGGLGM